MMANPEQGPSYPFTVGCRGNPHNSVDFFTYNILTGEEYGPFGDSDRAWKLAEEKAAELRAKRKTKTEE